LCDWRCRSNRWTLIYDGCSAEDCQGDCLSPNGDGTLDCTGREEEATGSTGCDSGGRPRQCC
jgi:hypothetical protein